MKCPVCGKTDFPKRVTARVCPVCEWHDDVFQRNDHNCTTETNPLSINEQRIEFFLLNSKKTAARARRLQDKYYKNCDAIRNKHMISHKIAYEEANSKMTAELDEVRIQYSESLAELLLSLIPADAIEYGLQSGK